jgi:hypothetical protein
MGNGKGKGAKHRKVTKKKPVAKPKPGRKLREVLKVKPVPVGRVEDTFQNIQVEERRRLFEPDLSGKARTISQDVAPGNKLKHHLPPDATEEQRALVAAAESVAPLMQQPEIRRVLGAFIAFRQAYALAYRELQDRLAAYPDLHPMAEDLLVQSSIAESNKPFDEHALMDGFINTVLPWAADVVDRHAAKEEVEVRTAKLEAQEAKRKTPIPIGFKHTPQQEDGILERDRPLVLVGYQPALLWLLDQITTHILLAKKPAFTVIRFVEFAPKEKMTGDLRLVRLPVSKWKGCANSVKGVPTVMGTHVADKLTDQPDVLICDNMLHAHTDSFTGRAEGAIAGDANKRLAAWCKEASAALIGCVPLQSREAPILTDQEYEQLKTFTHLRSVAVLETADDLAADHVRIIISHNVAVFDVPKETLEGYGKPLIYT